MIKTLSLFHGRVFDEAFCSSGGDLNLRPLGYERYFRGFLASSSNSILGSIGDKLPSQQRVAAVRRIGMARRFGCGCGLAGSLARWFWLAENLSVRRGGRRCLCGACEPVSQHGAEGLHENRGLLP